MRRVSEALEFPQIKVERLLNDPFTSELTAKEAFTLSQGLQVPLHPKFTFFWSNLSCVQDIWLLKDWLSKSNVTCDDGLATSIVGEFDPDVSKVLRKIFAPHRVSEGKIVLSGEDARALAFSLGNGTSSGIGELPADAIFTALAALSGVQVRDKAPSYVGARMGRPEKAKRREMKPLVHVLFPSKPHRRFTPRLGRSW